MKRSLQALLSAILIGSLFSGSLVACSKDSRMLRNKYEQDGTKAFGKGQFDEAVIDFENLVKVDPHSGQSHYLLAKAFEKKGWIVDSVSQYRDSIRFSPQFLPAHLALAEYGLSTGQFKASLKEARTVLRLEPENIRARVILVRLSLFRKNNQEARRILHAILKKNPQSISTTLALADLDLLSRQTDRARILYRKVTATLAPKDPDAWVGLGRVEMISGHLAQAQSDFEKAIVLNPANVNNTLALASFYVQQGHVSKALSRLRSLSRDHVDIRVPLKMGEYELILHQTAKARGFLLPLQGSQFDLPELHAALAEAYLQDHQERMAYTELSGLIQKEPDYIRARTMMARILWHEGHPLQAYRLLDSAPVHPPFPADYWILRVQLARRNVAFPKAWADVHTGLSENPESRLLKIEEIILYQTTHLWREGLIAADAFLSRYPDDRAGILEKVFFMERLHRTREALSFLEASRKKSGSDPVLELDALPIIGHVQGKQSMEDSAKEFLKANPRDVMIMTWLATFDARNGHFRKANALWMSIVKIDPNNSAALIALSEEAMRQKHYLEAVKRLKAGIAAYPHSEQLHLLLGEALRGANHPEGAMSELREALRILPSDSRGHWDLAQLDFMKNRLSASESHLNVILKANSMKPDFHARVLGLRALINARS